MSCKKVKLYQLELLSDYNEKICLKYYLTKYKNNKETFGIWIEKYILKNKKYILDEEDYVLDLSYNISDVKKILKIFYANSVFPSTLVDALDEIC